MFSNSAARVLIADDEEKNRKLLEFILSAEGYKVVSAENGTQAIDLAAKQRPDLIILDVMMPGLDGFETAKRIKLDAALKMIPIIFITVLDDRASRLRGLEAGAEEFLNKPIDRAELIIRTRNLIKLKAYHDLLNNHNEILQTKVEEQKQRLQSSYLEAVFKLVKAAEYKDEETGAHVQRISIYCAELAAALGLNGEFIDQIKVAAPMHDVGKIGIPDRILLKEGPFADDEWAIMKSHSRKGYDLLSGSASPYLQMGAEIALGHHERWDGSGYPGGLKGDAIPLSARIMNLCDQYDALRSKRPYKPAISHDEVCDILFKGDGRTQPEHFDPAVLNAFASRRDIFRDIFDRFKHMDGWP